jgi:Mitochondrial carrier protein
MDCFTKVVKEGGFIALYRGLPVALAGVVLFKALFMGGYDTSKVRNPPLLLISFFVVSFLPSFFMFIHYFFFILLLLFFHFFISSFSFLLLLFIIHYSFSFIHPLFFTYLLFIFSNFYFSIPHTYCITFSMQLNIDFTTLLIRLFILLDFF